MKKIALVFLFVISPGLVSAMTRREIRLSVRDIVSDKPRTQQRFNYGNTELNKLINDVQRDVNAMTWAVESSTSILLVASQAFYELPSDMIAPLRTTFSDASSVKTFIREDSERSVVESSPDFERNSVGKPTRYFLRQQKDGDNTLEIGVIPIPNSSSTGTLTMNYVAQPVDMDEDTDVPFNGLLHLYPYHTSITWGVCLRIAIIEGDATGADIYGRLYDRSIQSLKDSVGRMPAFRPSASPGGSQ